MKTLESEQEQRLQEARIVWIATVRPDGRPHLVPVWFVKVNGNLYCCIEPESVKGRNLRSNRAVCLAVEDGVHPIICEGEGRFIGKPWPDPVVQAFQLKYEWNIASEDQYTALVEVVPEKWLCW